MLKLRLQRHGSKKKPFYRVIVTESASPRDGRFIEIVGTYDSVAKPAVAKIDEEKVLSWLKKGAKPTDTVKNLLSNEGIWAKFKTNKK